MRKTLLLFTPMALALLLAAGTAWAALPAPTVVSTVPPNGATGVVRSADITAQFSEAMRTKSLGICNHCTSTISSKTFYLLEGQFIGSATKNPPRFCAPPGTTPSTSSPPCPQPIPATVSYTAATFTATLNPSSTLDPLTKYTAVVEGAGDGDKVSVKDADGTPMAKDYIFSFTTAP
jgi:Bacterial Ig-like domain